MNVATILSFDTPPHLETEPCTNEVKMAAAIVTTVCETGLSVRVSPVSLSRFLNTGWRWGGALDLSLLSLWAARQQTAALNVCPTLLATSLTSPCRCVEVLERTQRSLKVHRNLLASATLTKQVSS